MNRFFKISTFFMVIALLLLVFPVNSKRYHRRNSRNYPGKRVKKKRNPAINKVKKVLKASEPIKKTIPIDFETQLGKAYAKVQRTTREKHSYLSTVEEKKIVIVMPSYNNEKWYQQNLDSVLGQNYENFRVIYKDDISKDRTADLVVEYLAQHPRGDKVLFIKNEQKMLAMANIYYAIHNHCEDEELVVIVDGDDFLAHENVLKQLNYVYSKQDVWLTFGNNLCLSNLSTCSWSMPVPKNIIQKNQFRRWPHGQTHLRTFYSWLFKKIDEADLRHKGEFYKMTYDVAMLLPMIEMAGERHQFIPNVLYLYNDLNNINDHKKNGKLQHSLNKLIRSKKPYFRLPKNQMPSFMVKK